MVLVSTRVLSIAVISVGLGLGSVTLPAQAAPSPRHVAPDSINYQARGQQAAEWQATQLRKGHMPSGFPGYPDWGLTIDVAFMLAADGSQPNVLARVKRAIAHHITDYAVYQGDTASGAMAKVLVASKVLKADPSSFGGINVRKRVLKLVAPASAGFEHGRLRDTGATDYSNVLGQSFGTIGLARSGSVPQSVVDYLLKQRCHAGYFRIVETVGQTCDGAGSEPDVDATAVALQALVAAKADGAAVGNGVVSDTAAWLASVQHGNGSFGGGTSTPDPNANSTGLAAQALVAAGRPAARLRAASWVASVQVTARKAGQGPAKTDIGAIAYNRDAFNDGIANGLGANRPQWWRATPQGFFAFVPVPLGTLTAP